MSDQNNANSSHPLDPHAQTAPASGDPAHDSAAAAGRKPESIGAFGMLLFLISLTLLFGAAMIAYWIIRSRMDVWPPLVAEDQPAPPLPWILWLSTGIILVSSATMAAAVGAAKRANAGTLKSMLTLTTVLGFAFLVLQGIAWFQVREAYSGFDFGIQAFAFYFLTIVHAAHVIGGLVALVFCTRNAIKGAYTADHWHPVRLAGWYWHYLDAVWVVVFVSVFVV